MNDIQEIHQDCQESFFVFSDFSDDLANSIELAGISTLRTHYRISRHNMASHLLQFTISGQGKLHLDGVTSPIYEGSITILPVGKSFSFELDADHWHMAWFLLRDTPRWKSLYQAEPGVYGCREASLVQSCLRLLNDHHQVYDQQDTLTETQLFNLMGNYIDRALRREHKINRAQERLLKLFERVKSQLHYPWSVAELAHRLHISEPHLFRLCQQAYGTSPKQHLTTLRLEHACELLRHTNTQVEQVALAVGYRDANAFTYRFRSAFGVPPGQWRLQHRR